MNAEAIQEAATRLAASREAEHRHAEKLQTLRDRLTDELATEAEAVATDAACLAAALGDDPTAVLALPERPESAAKVKALETAIHVAELAARSLASNTQKAEVALNLARVAALRDQVEKPEVAAGMAALGTAYRHFQRALASRVTAKEFGLEPRIGAAVPLEGFYGPLGEILHSLAMYHWSDDIRPDWAPKHPGFKSHYPHDREKVREAAAKLRAELLS